MFNRGQNPPTVRRLVYIAEKEDEGRTVRDVLQKEWHLVHHDLARAKYDTENGITVNGEVSFVNRRLKEGDTLVFLLADAPSETSVPARGPLTVLYEDEDLIAVDKPAGVLVHPSHGHFSDTMANFVAGYFQEKGEAHGIRTVGRLDKDTTGVLLFAKSRSAVAALNYRRKCEKTYFALFSGNFPADALSGEVDVPLGPVPGEKTRQMVTSDGKPALTRYRVLWQGDGYGLLEAKIDTGRTHQIRVHLSYLGHPLLGDPLYGEDAGACDQHIAARCGDPPYGEGAGAARRGEKKAGENSKEPDGKNSGQGPAVRDTMYGGERGENSRWGLSRTALHAGILELTQPFTGARICVESPLPADMAALLPEELAGLWRRRI